MQSSETRTGSQAVERAMAVLDSFAGRTRLSLTEVVRETGLPVSTTHRIVSALCRGGFLERDGDDAYRIGSHVRDLVVAHSGLVEIIAPRLHALSTGTKLTVSFGVLDGDRVQVLHRARAAGDPEESVSRRRLEQTALGLALLAFHPSGPTALRALGSPAHARRLLAEDLERIRRRGFAQIAADGGRREVAVAAGTVGALGVAGPQTTLTDAMVQSVLPALQHFAGLIFHDVESRLVPRP